MGCCQVEAKPWEFLSFFTAITDGAMMLHETAIHKPIEKAIEPKESA